MLLIYGHTFSGDYPWRDCYIPNDVEVDQAYVQCYVEASADWRRTQEVLAGLHCESFGDGRYFVAPSESILAVAAGSAARAEPHWATYQAMRASWDEKLDRFVDRTGHDREWLGGRGVYLIGDNL